jgi:succinate dehydrogenase / fumarate reductase iron-sulfur subunit
MEATMSESRWTVTYLVHRQKGDAAPHVDRFMLQVDPDEYVLDGVERIWAFEDRSLTFRHACHHSTCGACGMRVNGVEKLTCITRIRDVTIDGGVIKVEPLRNFPVISDLVVDMSALYLRMEQTGLREVMPLREVPDPELHTIAPAHDLADEQSQRLIDCIECGLCVSACPVATMDPDYLGPAALAAIHLQGLDHNGALTALADQQHGAWRCHSAFECTAVCPAFVEPAWRIMDLRKQLLGQRFRRLFQPIKEAR